MSPRRGTETEVFASFYSGVFEMCQNVKIKHRKNETWLR